jgi:hypothetical protein
MTTITRLEADTAPIVKVPMRAYLEGLHDQWREEVRGVLDPARERGSGIWRRWRAVEYLQGGFNRRFERERRAVFSLHQRLTPDQAGHLWAGAELIAQLIDGLGHRVGLCQSDQQFASVSLTVVGALDYWCRQVEEALGPVRWGDVPPESRAAFETIRFDEEEALGD